MSCGARGKLHYSCPEALAVCAVTLREHFLKAALLQGAWHLVTERENLASANCGADAADKYREADQREHGQWCAPIGEGRDLIRVEAKVGSREVKDRCGSSPGRT